MNGATSKITEQKVSLKSYEAKAFAANSPTSGLAPSMIQRREPGAQDLQIAGSERGHL